MRWHHTGAPGKLSLEVSVTGLDLFDASHAEWGVAPGRPEFEPSVYAYVRWQGWRSF